MVRNFTGANFGAKFIPLIPEAVVYFQKTSTLGYFAKQQNDLKCNVNVLAPVSRETSGLGYKCFTIVNDDHK
jgi:hypothetical protein